MLLLMFYLTAIFSGSSDDTTPTPTHTATSTMKVGADTTEEQANDLCKETVKALGKGDLKECNLEGRRWLDDDEAAAAEKTLTMVVEFENAKAMSDAKTEMAAAVRSASQTIGIPEPTGLTTVTKSTEETTEAPDAEDPNDLFSMTGACDTQGDCVSSKNYPDNHGNNESCSITMLQDTRVSVGSIFNLQSSSDFLKIRWQFVESSSDVPKTLDMGETFTWRTDGLVTHEGWQLCFTPRN